MKHLIKVKTAIVLLSTALLCACDNEHRQAIAADDYFPLSSGHHWRYRTSTDRGGELTHGEYQVHNRGEVERDLNKYLLRVNNHGTEYLFQQDDSGVYRVGVRTLVSDKIKHDLRKRYVLKRPLQKDNYWFADSHAFVIERTQPVHEKFWNSHIFEMEYQITELDETVHVPAGSFEHCLRVEARGIVKLLADVTQGRYGSAEGEIHTTEWYAPGIGMVKMHREETFVNSLFVDGSYTVELLETSAQ